MTQPKCKWCHYSPGRSHSLFADHDYDPEPPQGAGVDEVVRFYAAYEKQLNEPLPAPELSQQWRLVDSDTAFAPPFGTIRACRICGCLVAGGPTACSRCVAEPQPAPKPARLTAFEGLYGRYYVRLAGDFGEGFRTHAAAQAYIDELIEHFRNGGR